MLLEEQMSGPQAVRYDDVYYPRTDKRAISKSNKRASKQRYLFGCFERKSLLVFDSSQLVTLITDFNTL